MINKNLDNEGCILTIHSNIRNDELKVYWNADTPERSKEMSAKEEIFMHIKTSYLNKTSSSSIAISIEEARALIDTLHYMIHRISQ